MRKMLIIIGFLVVMSPLVLLVILVMQNPLPSPPAKNADWIIPGICQDYGNITIRNNDGSISGYCESGTFIYATPQVNPIEMGPRASILP